MVRLAAILIAIVACGAAGMSFGASPHTEITVYPDGLAHVTAQVEVDPQEPSFVVGLLGTAVDNFVAVDEDGVLLAAERTGVSSMELETFGSGLVNISYDVHDIVSKDGRIWTFSLDIDHEYILLMPGGAVIVGMNAIPRNLDTVGERVRLEMPGGPAEISYITNTARSVEPVAPPATPAPDDEGPSGDSGTLMLLALPLAAGAAGAFLAIRARSRRPGGPAPHIGEEPEPLDPEAVFARVPGLRDEDKEIVRYICENGGEVSESRLRKKLLRPRTSMWRAVQRLSREGAVDIIKRDSHNQIRIRRGEGPQ